MKFENVYEPVLSCENCITFVFRLFLLELEEKGDEETAAIARLEQAESEAEAKNLETTLLDQLLPVERVDDLDIILEVSFSAYANLKGCCCYSFWMVNIRYFFQYAIYLVATCI